jgi:hypothetical protein
MGRGVWVGGWKWEGVDDISQGAQGSRCAIRGRKSHRGRAGGVAYFRMLFLMFSANMEGEDGVAGPPLHKRGSRVTGEVVEVQCQP